MFAILNCSVVYYIIIYLLLLIYWLFFYILPSYLRVFQIHNATVYIYLLRHYFNIKHFLLTRYITRRLEPLPGGCSPEAQEAREVHPRCSGPQARCCHQRGSGDPVLSHRCSPWDPQRYDVCYVYWGFEALG